MEQVYDELKKLIDYYRPEAMAVEELFFNTNSKTAIHVAQARGVIASGKAGGNRLWQSGKTTGDVDGKNAFESRKDSAPR